MNKKSTSFLSHANGASDFEFTLFNVNIDNLTSMSNSNNKETLFTSIMRSLKSPFPSSFPNAVTFYLGKSVNKKTY